MQITIDAELLADFLSGILGDDHEVAIHDLSNVESSLKVIRNGWITKREVGSPATDLALMMAKEQNSPACKLNYSSKTQDGRSLRSSSLILPRESGAALMVCINSDDQRYYRALEAVKELLPKAPDQQHLEVLANNVEEVGMDILREELRQYGSQPEKLLNEEKSQIVRELDKRGLFMIKGFISNVASILDISEPTLYRYLKR
ncbi:helix-turn-helix transcriptional regulator [Dongshaea marina]|uniref:helix-turn-helix transcriptional regulator n=1 Tax=Dongshaea marina TaxID=2047966 RepID=UPI000D3E50F3|nr:PAS domain-containing protein [Dongshaea marina]